jgi:hypothetical protein
MRNVSHEVRRGEIGGNLGSTERTNKRRLSVHPLVGTFRTTGMPAVEPAVSRKSSCYMETSAYVTGAHMMMAQSSQVMCSRS